LPTSLSPVEILVILVVALIVLGPNQLPKAGRQVGKALAEMRRWSRGIQSEIRDAFDTEPEPPLVSSEQVKSESVKSEPVTTEPVQPEPAETEPVKTDAGPPVATTPAPPPEKPDVGPVPPMPTNGSAPVDEPPRN
jgi:Tat protein translocase TatB subunit